MSTDHRSSRREVVVGTTAAAAMLFGGSAAEGQSATKTFVLVHGAWHGGWCYRRVADMLTAKGHKVYTPTLTGLGERSHLMSRDIRLTTHIDDIVNVIKWEGLNDIVLVGHSYGGMVVSGVAEKQQPTISSIVFLDAFLPDDGKSLDDYTTPQQSRGLKEAADRGDIGLKPIPAAAFKVNEKDAAWVDAMCTPQPIRTFLDTIALTGAREKISRKTYIRATLSAGAAFAAAYQKVQADRSWQTYEVATGHDVMVDDPARLTEILLEVA